MSNTIDVEATTSPAESPPANQGMALERRPDQAVGRALSIDQVHERLEFIRNVMNREMKEGQDYGKIPGTGDKPSLLQPGAQKLLMTFNLREQVKREVLRDFPGYHREYEFTMTVFPSGSRPEDGWDGVGTCSTLESKYRYRKAERVCPVCKKPNIIAENPKFVPAGQIPGFLCWRKKGGCGAHFADNAPEILSQPVEDVENEDPADCWNTVRKMAFKRALIHAAINATNTSELWTGDLEDMAENEAARPKKGHTAPQAAPGAKTPPSRQAPPAQNAKATPPAKADGAKKTPPPPADDQTRARMIAKLEKSGLTDLATEYFRKLADPAVILDNENLIDVPLEFVPITQKQMTCLEAAITDFGNGDDAKHAFPPNPRPLSAPAAQAKVTPVLQAAKEKDPEWWRKVVVPVPYKGQKRDEYMKAPETVGQLYDRRHEDGPNRRLFGFINHFEVQKTWTNGQGQTVMRSQTQVDADTLFRDALDACNEFHEKHGGDTEHRQPKDPADEQAQAEAEAAEAAEDPEIPF